MVAKPPGGRPEIVVDEPAPPVGTPAFLPLPAALLALSWLSTAALVAAPPESLRPTKPDPSLTALPGRGTPAPGLTAAPTCRAASPCREAAPPAHARFVYFVCCMSSLLFCSYVLFTPGDPTASYFALRQPVTLIPYIPRTLVCCKASQFRLPSDATRTASEPFLWCHPRKQNGHTRHLVATKVGAVVFATSEQESSECGRRMGPNAHGCRSSDRADRCCMHHLGRGRGGRREGE